MSTVISTTARKLLFVHGVRFAALLGIGGGSITACSPNAEPDENEAAGSETIVETEAETPDQEDIITPPGIDPEDAPIKMVATEEELETAGDNIQASLNPFENDLRNLEVAFRLKDAFPITEKGAKFMLAAVMADGSIPIDESFSLVPTQDITSPHLEAEIRDGFYIATFKLADADKARIHAAAQTLQEMKKVSSGDNELKLNAVAYTCFDETNATADDDTYSLSAYFRSAESVDFIDLTTEWLMIRGKADSVDNLWNACKSE